MVDAAAVRDRATIDRYEPPVYGLDRPMWVAEDPVTGCVGVGRVEAEAVGNLLAVVDSHGEEGDHLKMPGQVVERDWRDTGRERLVDRLREWLPP